MEGQFSYQDFDLLIEPGPPGSYRARMLRSPAGECALVQFTLPFSEPELETSCSSSARAAAAAGPVARKRAAERLRRQAVRRGIPRRAAGRIATQPHPDPRAAGGDAAAAGR